MNIAKTIGTIGLGAVLSIAPAFAAGNTNKPAPKTKTAVAQNSKKKNKRHRKSHKTSTKKSTKTTNNTNTTSPKS